MKKPLRSLGLCGLFLCIAGSSAWAQTVTVTGRVEDAVTRSPITGAAVSVAGVGDFYSNALGQFRFAGVPAGTRLLTVRALGYAERRLQLELQKDTALVIALAVDPLLMDSLRVGTRFIEVSGRLIERATGRFVIDAAVLATPNRNVRTNKAGAFRFRRVPASVPLQIQVTAFSYEPVLVSFVPERDTTIALELAADTMVQRLIGEQYVRLEQRMKRGIGEVFSVPRTQLLQREWGSLAEALAWIIKYAPYSPAKQTVCVYVDERLIGGSPAGMLLPEEVERVEYHFDGAMLRIYTRRFMARMVSGAVKLGIPSYTEVPRGMRGNNEPQQTFCY